MYLISYFVKNLLIIRIFMEIILIILVEIKVWLFLVALKGVTGYVR